MWMAQQDQLRRLLAQRQGLVVAAAGGAVQGVVTRTHIVMGSWGPVMVVETTRLHTSNMDFVNVTAT